MTLLTVPQAAKELAMSRKTVDRLIQTGALPVVRIGRSVRIDPADLAIMIHTQKVRPTHRKEETSCSTNVALSGGSASPRQTDAKYAKLLKLPTGGKPRNTTTGAKPSSGE